MSYMLHFYFVLLGIFKFSLSRDGGMTKQVFVLSTNSKKYEKGNLKTFQELCFLCVCIFHCWFSSQNFKVKVGKNGIFI